MASTQSLKDLFPMKILQEIATTPATDTYDISGISDLSKVQYFYRLPTQAFKELQPSDYTITESGHTATIRIKNASLLSQIEFLQVAEKIEDESKTYKPTGDPSLPLLIEAYNELVTSFKALSTYAKDTMMICDTPSMTKVLPKLNDGEAWVYDLATNTFKGFPVLDLNKIADQEIVRIKQVLDDYADQTIKPALLNYGHTTMDHYWNATIKPTIDAHTNTKKVEITDHTTQEKQILTNARDQYLTDLQDKFNDLQLDHGVVPDGTDVHTLVHGRHWVADSTKLTNMVQGAEPSEQRGYLTVNDVDGQNKKVISFYSISGLPSITFQTSSNTWTPWESLSKDLSYIPIGFLGNDLAFAPVMWSETSNRWVRADDTGADGIIVNGHTSNGRIYTSGTLEIPGGAVDSLGQPFVRGEWYFLSTTGKIQRAKPTTGLWQVLGQCSGEPTPTHFTVKLSEPEDITYIVMTPSGEKAIVTQDHLTAELLKKADKEDYKMTIYNSIGQLGLPSPTTTKDIIEAMDDSSIGVFPTLTDLDISDHPQNGVRGLMIIYKINRYRIEITFKNSAQGNFGYFIGNYYDGVWDGWTPIITKTKVISIQEWLTDDFKKYFESYTSDSWAFINGNKIRFQLYCRRNSTTYTDSELITVVNIPQEYRTVTGMREFKEFGIFNNTSPNRLSVRKLDETIDMYMTYGSKLTAGQYSYIYFEWDIN